MKYIKHWLILFVFVFLIPDTIHANTISFTLVENGITRIIEMKPIRLFMNGSEMLDLPAAPVIYNDHTLVPAREVFEPLGAFVDWNDHTREVYIVYEGSLIILKMDSDLANINGTDVQMSIPVKNINNRTMIPARFVSESLNFGVEWDDETRSVYIWTEFENSIENELPIIPDHITESEPVSITEDDLSTDVSVNDIVAMGYPETYIIAVDMLPAGEFINFRIRTSSEISDVNRILLEDNRLVVDIVNANIAMGPTVHQLDGLAGVSAVRIGQFETDPIAIARVVFDLNMPLGYDISLSADRMTLSVSFEKNSITDVTFHSDGTNDFITIYATNTPNLSVHFLEDPDRLVIDIIHSTAYPPNIIDSHVEGAHATSIYASQFSESMVRIIVNLSSNIIHAIRYEEDRAIIVLREMPYRGVFFDIVDDRIVMERDPENILSASSLQIMDDYLNLRHVIRLPGNFETHFGDGTHYMNSNGVEKISVTTNEQTTYIIIHTERILAPIVTEDERYIYIKLVHPREVYERIVILDPGHGGIHPGAVQFGYLEKDLVLTMALMLYDMLQQNENIRAYSIRLTDKHVYNRDRAIFANDLGDLFISIHANSVENAYVSGTETYYWLRDDEHYMGISSREVAEIMQYALLDALGFIDRGIKREPFIVLTQTEMPAVLLEVGFMSNEAEMRRLATEDYQRRAMRAVYYAIQEVFSIYTPAR